MSNIRRNYFIRLILRIIILIACGALCFLKPQWFNVLDGLNFFKGFSPLHLLWLIWFADMFQQVVPVKNQLALGSQKLFSSRFKPIREKIDKKALKKYITETTASAYLVLLIWSAFITVIALLYYFNYINKMWLFMISVLFYVCDLICVLIWCPFRLIMRNRCCTTCRIFNWDHLMMFSPIIFMGGFYAVSLFVMAFFTWLVWEFCVLIYPERFWYKSNNALKCSECTDKLCTQYCQKLRK